MPAETVDGSRPRWTRYHVVVLLLFAAVFIRAAADEARADRARREAGWVPSLGPGPFMADGLLAVVARFGRLHPFYRWPRRRWGVPYGLR